jgi:hypothetical protein
VSSIFRYAEGVPLLCEVLRKRSLKNEQKLKF